MASELPSIRDLVAPILETVSEDKQPLLIALAERLAAACYRGWASEASEADRERLLACADREQEIARRVESLYPDAAAVQADLHAKHPDLERFYRDLFRGQLLEGQYAIQAQGERLGASTWRAYAARADDQKTRHVFEGCAELEEANAVVLDALIDRARSSR